ncbi:MAG: hypothetical protein ACPGU1_17170 [Myxococcota bacterium]
MQLAQRILCAAIFTLAACGDTNDPLIAPDNGDASPSDDIAATGPSCESNADCGEAPSACALVVCVDAVCVTRDQADGAPCDDGEPCSLESTCLSGVCESGTAWQDCDDGNPCTADGCQPGSGCTHSALTGPCDDGNPCTTGDICAEGTCAGSDSGLCTCQNDADCAAFGDTDLCNGSLVCVAGQCTIDTDTAVTCPAAGPCEESACDPSTGQCVTTALADGSPCSDGDSCTGGDVCADALCVGTPQCPCETVSDCDAFEDGDLCNGVLSCTDGFCGVDLDTIVTCEDALPLDCVAVTCTPESGLCETSTVADGSPCESSDACIEGAQCNGGLCAGGQARDCNDSNPCTIDLCAAGLGCEHQAADGQPCDDGDACTSGDICDDKVCVGPNDVCVCGDGFCSTQEANDCSCPVDCGDCNKCGNGVCDPGEEQSCPQDCGGGTGGMTCGDGICDLGEEFTCPQDCGGGAGSCGDGVCDFGEEILCPQDCGGGGTGACGDGVCEAGESLLCPEDCCGDGVCDLGEEFLCPEDCGGGGLCDNVCDAFLDQILCPSDCCGDGMCDGTFEDEQSCPIDCAESVCGDGTCELTEDSGNCPEDCEPPALCGNLICEDGEDEDSCAVDCAPDIVEDDGDTSDAGANDAGDAEEPLSDTAEDVEIGPEDTGAADASSLADTGASSQDVEDTVITGEMLDTEAPPSEDVASDTEASDAVD